MSGVGNGWSRYEERVLQELRDVKADLLTLRSEVRNIQNEEITNMKVEIAMLKVKSGVWGAAAGLIPAALLVGYELMKGT